MPLRRAWICVAVLLLAACGARTELDATERGVLPEGGAGPGGAWPVAICPPDVETTPLTEVQLNGAGQDDGEIVAWQWELSNRPVGSSASEPAPEFSPITFFTPDLAGEYRVRLTVTDDDGLRDSCDVRVRAITGESFRIEMYWNPPESPYDPTDVDLHLLHPAAHAWFDSWLDCHYSNCSMEAGMHLDWDNVGYAADDPRLDLDDVDGYGPENINIEEPIIGQPYRVGAHYFSDDGWGPSQVFIKIYCGENNLDPIYERGPVELVGDQSWEYNEFWKVATVVWDGVGCSVTPLDLIVSTQEAMSAP